MAGLVDTEGAMSKWWLLAVLGGVVDSEGTMSKYRKRIPPDVAAEMLGLALVGWSR